MKKVSGLRKRWLINTLGVVLSVGLVCVFAVTAFFATYYYSTMSSDLRFRAETTSEFFEGYVNLNYNEFYRSCMTYAANFDDGSDLELQFINNAGQMVASSYGDWAGLPPKTTDITDAVNTRGPAGFVGINPDTGERILAVSCPMIYSNGEVIGVLRYVTSTRIMDLRYVTSTKLVDRQIISVGLVCFLVLMVVAGVVVFSGSFFIRSVMNPVAEITEKAKRIAAGSYGVQIQTRYADEIGELAETINEMSAKISQNEKMQAEFISQLSHELRTPLTAINGWSETLLADENMDPDTRQGMKIISREAKRLTEMVMDLLDFTRMQDGRMTLNVETTDIRSEFEDTVFMYGSRLVQDGIELEYIDSDADIPEIPCDPQRLRQVFLNILDNAAKHGGDGKRIEASMDFEDHHVIAVFIHDMLLATGLGSLPSSWYLSSSD